MIRLLFLVAFALLLLGAIGYAMTERSGFALLGVVAVPVVLILGARMEVDL